MALSKEQEEIENEQKIFLIKDRISDLTITLRVLQGQVQKNLEDQRKITAELAKLELDLGFYEDLLKDN